MGKIALATESYQHASRTARTNNEYYNEKLAAHNELVSSKQRSVSDHSDDPDIVRSLHELGGFRIEAELADKESRGRLNELNDLRNGEPKFTFNFAIDIKSVVAQLNEQRKWIESEINKINHSEYDKNELRTFIESAKPIIESAGAILESRFFNSIGRYSRKGTQLTKRSLRMDLSLKRLFETGLNFLVLGEAGAGKSTSLMMYAQHYINNEEKNVVYIALGRLVQHWLEVDGKKGVKLLVEQLELGIVHYLNLNNIAIRHDEFVQLVESKEMVILLDGIDEAIKVADWLPSAINFFQHKYRSCLQLIVSTRLSSTFLNKLPFFPVTLLPFSIEQRDKFIENWFKENTDDRVVSRIKTHLASSPGISEIVRNPLLTTTLCVLAEHKLQLPKTEINLYDQRIRLLTGYYDNVKNIQSRVSIAPAYLETLSQRLAFYLHTENVREAGLDELYNIAKTRMSNELNPQQAVTAVDELIDPCNILMPMSDLGTYGFGHLRYQEHLAARELHSNRSIEILPILKKEGWKDVLMLFARMSSDLMWLVSHVARAEKMEKHYHLLWELAGVRPAQEQNNLKDLLNRYYSPEDEVGYDEDDGY